MSTAPNNAKAEAAARSRGYTGVFPPPPRPRVDTAEELTGVLDRIAGGELSANCIAAASDHLLQFFAGQTAAGTGLTAERFRDFGETIVRAVLWDELTPSERGNVIGADAVPTARVQLRAIRASVKPMLDLLAQIGKLARQRGAPPPLLDHLLRCVRAFLEPFAGDRMPRIAAVLAEMATQRRDIDLAIRAADNAIKLLTAGVSAALDTQTALAAPPTPIDEAKMAAARQALQAAVDGAQARLAKGGRR